MKKFTIVSLCALFVLVGLSASAQEQGEIRASVGLAAGSKASFDESGEKFGLGINIGGEYFATDEISIAPSYTFFFPTSVSFFGETVDYTNSSFNLDGRYYFGDSDLQLYGLAGLSFAAAKAEGGGETEKSSKTGLNLGAGLNYPLSDTMFLNGQVKYNTPFEQLVINAGIAFSFGG